MKAAKSTTPAPGSQAIERRLIAWAEQRDFVRAMLITSTRADPAAAVDAYSDYDIVLVVADVRAMHINRNWLADFGPVMVSYWDPVFLNPTFGLEQTGNVTYYMSGLHIDFSLWPIELMRRIAAAPTLPDDLDVGYRVLLDKDGLTDGLRPPTHTAYIPKPPTESAFQQMIEDFLSDAPYVAKCLLRDELLPAKWCLDYDMKHVFLRPMLEWHMECDHGWQVPLGVLGKGLKRRLRPDLWRELESTYASGDIESQWPALFRTLALFRRAGVDVANCLGFTYPSDKDAAMLALVQHMHDAGHAGTAPTHAPFN